VATLAFIAGFPIAGVLLLMALFVGAGILIVLLAFFSKAKRTKAFKQWAQANGLHYAERSATDYDRSYRGLRSLGKGSARKYLNEISGNYKGHHIRYFDYQFTVSNGKSSSQVTHGVFMIQFPGLHWPILTVVPETLLHKVYDAIGGDDIDFESDEFSRRFWVTCSDRKFAYDFIHPRVMERVLEHGPTEWQVHSNVLCTWIGSPPRVQQIQDTLDGLVALADLIPKRLTNVPAPPAASKPTFTSAGPRLWGA
jgi:hypothetical protein